MDYLPQEIDSVVNLKNKLIGRLRDETAKKEANRCRLQK